MGSVGNLEYLWAAKSVFLFRLVCLATHQIVGSLHEHWMHRIRGLSEVLNRACRFLRMVYQSAPFAFLQQLRAPVRGNFASDTRVQDMVSGGQAIRTLASRRDF